MLDQGNEITLVEIRNRLVVVLFRMDWWLCAYLLSIDASLAEGFTEGEFYEEEEENFDHYTNQGKPSCISPCKYSCKSHATHVLQMHVLQALLCLEKITGLDQSWLVELSQEHQTQPRLV